MSEGDTASLVYSLMLLVLVGSALISRALPIGQTINSDADKKVVQEAAAEATALQRKLAQESDEKMFAELKARGVQIDKVDQGPFMTATAPVIAKWEAGPIGPFVKKVVASARAK